MGNFTMARLIRALCSLPTTATTQISISRRSTSGLKPPVQHTLLWWLLVILSSQSVAGQVGNFCFPESAGVELNVDCKLGILTDEPNHDPGV